MNRNKYFLFVPALMIIVFIQTAFITNEPTNKAELGKMLFSDPILSKDYTVSCATCHIPERAFADTGAVSFGVKHAKGKRNTPSSMNMRFTKVFFWDGRAATLEQQALMPIEDPSEMNLPIEKAVQRLRKHKKYNSYFKKIFNSEPTAAHLGEAIAAFERTQETSESPFDVWKFYDEPKAVPESAKRGFDVFSTKGKCTVCHFGSDFTRSDFKNIGLFNGKALNDSGRAGITKLADDIGSFKTPGLRNIAITAPYMHNGMFKTLEEVIDFYNDAPGKVPDAINRDTTLAKPLGLTDQEKSDLKAFLESLTDKRFQR